MFPDITCDDIFRLETARLWLRWLRAADAPALAPIAMATDVAEASAFDGARSLDGAERYILHARAKTAGSDALILAVTAKNKGRSLVGIVSAEAAGRGEIEIGYIIAPQHTGRGYASEAVAALVEAAFNLTQARALVANSRPDNLASRRVLEKCNFVHVSTSNDSPGGDLYDRFRCERSTLPRDDRRRLPSMAQQPRPGPPLGAKTDT